MSRSILMRILSGLLLLTAFTAPLPAQVIDIPGAKGSTEFIGLKRRKAADVVKEYQDKNPKTPLHA
jgi:hypothetical protein